MQLHQVRPTHRLKKKKPRVGRGGKRGTYSGRGQKGQKARAGHKIRPAVAELINRLPKLKGFKNKSIKVKPLVVNLSDLVKVRGEKVNPQSLIEAGLIRKNRWQKVKRVKLLGRGEAKRSYQVKDLMVSQSAQTKIEKAKGHVE